MRTELMQMERMAIDERLGQQAGETARLLGDIRRRMRREKKEWQENQLQYEPEEQG